MRFINFTSARKLKADLDEKIENLGENREATSSTGSGIKVTVQVPTQTEMVVITLICKRSSLC